MAITLTRLSDALGCEVGGVDLAQPLDRATFEESSGRGLTTRCC